MADKFVKTTGNDSNSGDDLANAYLTVQKALDNVGSGDTVFIDDGTYTQNLSIGTACTVQSLNNDATLVTLTSSANGKTITLAVAAGTIIQDLTVNYTNSAAATRGAILSATTGVESATVRRCIVTTTAYGLMIGGNAIIDRCKVTGSGTSGHNWGILCYSNAIITSCITIDCTAAGYYLNDDDQYTQACLNSICIATVAGKNSYAGWYLTASNSTPYITISNCIMYNGPAGTSQYGFRSVNTSRYGVMKNCIVYDANSSPTMNTKEYYRTNPNWTKSVLYQTAGSGSEGTADTATPVFVDFAAGDYSPDASGSAFQGGTNTAMATYDYNGNPFDSGTPSIGAFNDGTVPGGGGGAGGSPRINNLNNLNSLKL